jgi:type II secretory pathway pseudopilin PulG
MEYISFSRYNIIELVVSIMIILIAANKEATQYNDQNKKAKRTNNYLQNTTHETKIEQHESLKIRE